MRSIGLTLAVVIVLATAGPASAQLFRRSAPQVCGPNGCPSAATPGLPSPAPFAPVPCFPPQAMPAAPFAAPPTASAFVGVCHQPGRRLVRGAANVVRGVFLFRRGNGCTCAGCGCGG